MKNQIVLLGLLFSSILMFQSAYAESKPNKLITPKGLGNRCRLYGYISSIRELYFWLNDLSERDQLKWGIQGKIDTGPKMSREAWRIPHEGAVGFEMLKFEPEYADFPIELFYRAQIKINTGNVAEVVLKADRLPRSVAIADDEGWIYVFDTGSKTWEDVVCPKLSVFNISIEGTP